MRYILQFVPHFVDCCLKSSTTVGAKGLSEQSTFAEISNYVYRGNISAAAVAAVEETGDSSKRKEKAPLPVPERFTIKHGNVSVLKIEYSISYLSFSI